MMNRLHRPPLSTRRPLRAAMGQALIEIFFVIILFFFIGVMAYETGIMYYNANQVSNALKQAVWIASIGAPDDAIIETVVNADESLFKSVFFDHVIDNFVIEVWAPTAAGEINIAPTVNDALLSPGTYNASTAHRAAYIWRAHGMNIRIGIHYKAGYVSPYFGATPVNLIDILLVQSQPVLIRNDEDFDGLVDLYEPELFRNALVGDASHTALCHTDSGLISDFLGYNLDADDIPDTTEGGLAMFDHNNNGVLDPFDPGDTGNPLRHPRLGGNPVNWP